MNKDNKHVTEKTEILQNCQLVTLNSINKQQIYGKITIIYFIFIYKNICYHKIVKKTNEKYWDTACSPVTAY